jgi:hypothetical protein
MIVGMSLCTLDISFSYSVVLWSTGDVMSMGKKREEVQAEDQVRERHEILVSDQAARPTDSSGQSPDNSVASSCKLAVCSKLCHGHINYCDWRAKDRNFFQQLHRYKIR